MDSLNLDKLISSIELILYKSLKENSDDSYSHKLIDLVDYVKAELTLDDLNKLSTIVTSSLNHETALDDIELSTAFKLIGTIVSDERMIKENAHVVITSFTGIIKFDQVLKDEDNPHYDLQYSFLKCINKFCSTQSGCQLLAQKDDLLLIIFHLLTKSQGFYVQMEAQSVITLLLTNILDQTDLTHRLSPYLHQMLLVNCKSHMECLNGLVKNTKMRHFLINRFKLDSILISKLNSAIKHDESLLIIFCQILATCEPPKESIDCVIKTLLESKKLKSIIAFYSTLIQYHGLNYLDGWKLFTVYPLIKSNDHLSGLIVGDEEMKKLIHLNVTNGELMFIFRCITVEIIVKLPQDDNLLLVNCVGHFLKESIDLMVPRKLLSESLQKFDLLWKTIDDPILIQRSLEIFLQLVGQIFRQQSSSIGNFKLMIFSLLKSIREIISCHRHLLPIEILTDLCSKINNILVSCSLEDNFDLIDSTLEIVISILQSNGESFVTLCPELVDNFLNQWTNCYQSSNDSSLISTCLPILLCLDLYSSTEQLFKHSIIKNQTIPTILNNYLNEGEYLVRDSVIKSIDYNFPTLIASDLWNHQQFSEMFTQFYGLPMSQLILSEIDSEVLSMILKIWITIIDLIGLKANQDDRCNLISMLYQSGLFTSLWLLLKDELVIGTIKSQAYQAAKAIFKSFQSNNLTENDLITIFSNQQEPQFFITVEHFTDGLTHENKNREQVIDEIFKEHSTLPTQDLINVVTEKLNGSKKLTKRKREIGQISVNLIASFFTKPIEPFELINETNANQTFNILDDIIAARSFNTRIPSDCY